MPAEAPLLEAIYAAPERDEPRLVYADWLLEQQNPRGELIRLQVEQARLLWRSAGWTRLQPRIGALWDPNFRSWIPEVKVSDRCQWIFTRGFATGIHTSAAAFAEALEAIFSAAPLLDEVELDFGHPGPLRLDPLRLLETIFAAPAFARVKTLRLQSLNDAGAIALSGLEATGNLRGLELARTDLGVETYQLLGSATSQLLKLSKFELRMANLGDVALENLLEHPWPRLESLSLCNEDLTERGLRAIIERGHLPRLSALDLSWSLNGGAKPIEVLARSALQTLDLSHCHLSDEMCEALAQATMPLRVLRLVQSEATGRGIAALLKAPFIDGLQLLDLSESQLDVRSQAMLMARLKDRVVLGLNP